MITMHNTSRRVVVTGLGVISPIGSTVETFWDALIDSRSGVTPMECLPTQPYPFNFAGSVLDFTGHINDMSVEELSKAAKKVVRKGMRVMNRETQMGVAAAHQALANAGFKPGEHDPERVGASFGTGYMVTVPNEMIKAIETCTDDGGEFDFNRWGDAGMREINPLWLLKYLPNMPACHIAIYNDFRGPNNSLTQGEVAANVAVGEAFHVIARGAADMMVAGATGTRLHPLRTIHTVLQEQIAPANGLQPEEISRPFDLNRTGMVVGEGAGAIVLEDYDAAHQRGATIHGEIVGVGSSC
ncbi:MAG: beta-ketoacyl-[acyl-carrier-protein] synthase family protein, partial [Planctomycetales bacterium]